MLKQLSRTLLGIFAALAFAVSANAQSLTMMNIGGAGSARVSTLCANVSHTSVSGSTSDTFTATSICSADPTRVLLIGVGAASSSGTSPTTLSVTVGGVSATSVITLNSGTANMLGVFAVPVASGTTATVVVTLTGGTTSSIAGGVMIWAVYGLSSTTATATNSGTGTSYSIAAAFNGSSILYAGNTNSPAPSFTFCAAQTQQVGGGRFYAGCLVNPVTGSSVSGTITYGAGTNDAFTGASFF